MKQSTTEANQQQIALLTAAFIIALCGLIYELLAGTLSSYLLGDSVYQFSLVIGLFMSAMGIGSWLSRYIEHHLAGHFISLQFAVGLLGGLMAPILFFAFAILDSYTPLLFVLLLVLGSLLGIEIPLIIRILKQHFSLKTNISNVFTLDYIGALIAALLFPLVLIPQLGLMQTGFVVGLLNVLIGFLAWYVFRHDLQRPTLLLFSGLAISGLLLFGLIKSNDYTTLMETRLYQDEIIHASNSQYQQRLVLTRRGQRLRFYINGALQFDSVDEYRYHEALVHPAMSILKRAEQVLILGGGDGLAAKQLLQYPNIQQITLVDLDPAVTQLFSQNPMLTTLNQNALKHPKLSIHNADAWKFLEQNQTLYDLILIDLPDPNNPSLSRLYSSSFYKLVKQHVSEHGLIVTQATSPLYARKAFWSINKTLTLPTNQEIWKTLPYHLYVPSFGKWGFVMAGRHLRPSQSLKLHPAIEPQLKYLNQTSLQGLFDFPPDIDVIDVEANHLSNHILMQYYQAGWREWYE